MKTECSPIQNTACFDVRLLSCYYDEECIFNNLNFSLAQGELLVITGPNGSGKTTLLKALAGLAPYEGLVEWQGYSILENRPEYNNNVDYLGHLSPLKLHLSVIENILLATSLTTTHSSCFVQSQMRSLLIALGLAKITLTQPVKALSAGQKRRLALLILVLNQKSLWLLDEPLTALDHLGKESFAQLLNQHLNRGGMAVATTHHQIEEFNVVNYQMLSLG